MQQNRHIRIDGFRRRSGRIASTQMLIMLVFLFTPEAMTQNKEIERPLKPPTAIESARSSMAKNDLATAALILRRSLADPALGEKEKRDTRRLLEFEIPVRQAQQAVINKKPKNARKFLQLALQRTSDFPEENEQIRLLLSSLDLLQEQAGNYSESAGKEVSRQLKKSIDDLYQRQGKIPKSLAELKLSLPLYKLSWAGYEIVQFTSDGINYYLTIRHRTNRENTLTLRSTGLMK